VYISLCSECISTQKPPAAESLHPLKVMISTTIGKHLQIDLIDYKRIECLGYCWILHLVDHHGGFAHVAAKKRKVGANFWESEFYVKEYFKTVNIYPHEKWLIIGNHVVNMNLNQ
jgi:hypothetical protein